MALCSLIGHQRHHDITDAVPKLAEKLHVSFNLSTYIGLFVKNLIKMNVNISNELDFSDVY